TAGPGVGFQDKDPLCFQGKLDIQEAPNHPGPVLVLGSGPIRIGQGIEFDYCSVHALRALREEGVRSVIINNNPETVSTDYDTGDRLYFEPLTVEDVMNVVEKERVSGVMVQFGGQTAINLAEPLAKRGIPILGTSLTGIDLAEDRRQFDRLLARLGIPRPAGGTATSLEGAVEIAKNIGYPVMVRPSYVLGGRGMEIVYGEGDLVRYMRSAVEVSPEKPVLIDRYVLGREVEVDAIADGQEVLIAGIMEHVERAGVHSGDSLSIYPSRGLSHDTRGKIVDYTRRLARGLESGGLLNIQFALEAERVFVLEANPRASRTVPFLSKATGLPIVEIATRVMLGKTLREQGYSGGLWPQPDQVAIKAPVFSFAKLRQVDPYLGPEMKSTGEVMGVGQSFAEALYKAITAANLSWPRPGQVLVSLGERDKKEALPILRDLSRLGFSFLSTEKTAAFLQSAGLAAQILDKGKKDWQDLFRKGEVVLTINTPTAGQDPIRFGFQLRRASVEYGVPFFTSLDTLRAVVEILQETAEKPSPTLAQSAEELMPKNGMQL
ncbi:MAG: carbamoyl-phosphate synthase large subunit, partial [Firmicutes bacterium]|nr:carbamoyl-phosphate synthase large subunit [Bacillota bacterium]